jgi:hypothetical protein
MNIQNSYDEIRFVMGEIDVSLNTIITIFQYTYEIVDKTNYSIEDKKKMIFIIIENIILNSNEIGLINIIKSCFFHKLIDFIYDLKRDKKSWNCCKALC